MSQEEQIRYHGTTEGERHKAERISQAREPYVPIKGKNGIELSDFDINFDKNKDRKLSVNLKYLKSVGGKTIDFRLYIDGYFTDFSKPAILKDPRSKTGDVVRAYAFCKEPLNNPNKCTYVVIDLYFLDLDDKLDKIQIEKRLDADFTPVEKKASGTPEVNTQEAVSPEPEEEDEVEAVPGDDERRSIEDQWFQVWWVVGGGG